MDRDEERTGRVPRRLLLVLIAAAIVALVLIVGMMVGGEGHGPARHFSVGAAAWHR
jgi:hypothetical protein